VFHLLASGIGYFVNVITIRVGLHGLMRLRTELYAVAALIGAAVVVIGRMLAVPPIAAASAGAVLCFGLRFMAMRRGWHLPTARAPRQPGQS